MNSEPIDSDKKLSRLKVTKADIIFEFRSHINEFWIPRMRYFVEYKEKVSKLIEEVEKYIDGIGGG